MKRQKTSEKDLQPVKPTQQQIENSALMGWKYTGDSIFEKGKFIGWFTERHGFQKT